MTEHEIYALPLPVREAFTAIANSELEETPEILELRKRIAEADERHQKRCEAGKGIHDKVEAIRKERTEALQEIERLKAARPSTVAMALFNGQGLDEDTKQLARIDHLQHLADAVKLSEPFFDEMLRESSREGEQTAISLGYLESELRDKLDLLRLDEAKRRAY